MLEKNVLESVAIKPPPKSLAYLYDISGRPDTKNLSGAYLDAVMIADVNEVAVGKIFKFPDKQGKKRRYRIEEREEREEGLVIKVFLRRVSFFRKGGGNGKSE